jgi:hypothetical protein
MTCRTSSVNQSPPQATAPQTTDKPEPSLRAHTSEIGSEYPKAPDGKGWRLSRKARSDVTNQVFARGAE